jgi:diguanylate cyclase
MLIPKEQIVKMDEVEQVNKSQTASCIGRFRAKRLIHILVAAELAIFLGAMQRILLNDYKLALLLGLVAAVLAPVYFLAKNNRAILGGNILTCILTTLCLFLMWIAEGPRDEVMLALPPILTFSILTGSLPVFYVLLAIIVINVLLLGYLNELGVVVNIISTNNLGSAFLIVTLLLITSFAIWLISRDLLNALLSLEKENKQVIQSQHEIEKLVHFDSLTGLANRVLAKLRFEYAIKLMQRNSKKLCLMFIDLDNFKYINDTLGHRIGDQYLAELAHNLAAIRRKSDVVCRLGGDEFLIILVDIEDHETAMSLAEQVLNIVKKPITIDGSDISSTCSIGLSMAPDDGIDFDDLCQKADMAMYQSKKKGKNEVALFTEELKKSQASSLSLIADMRQAIELNQFELYYQPQIALSDNSIVAAEALIRWNHPKLGQVSPVVFIPLAESSGQIIEIGQWVICEVLKQVKKWRISIDSNFRIAINISPLQFKRGTLCSFLSDNLQKFNLPGDCIDIEFTESLLIDNPLAVMNELESLKAAGSLLSIDDFGTGYSSLSYIQKLDIDSLKIDRSFISQMATNEKSLSIVKAIIQMSKGLNLNTIAEGIENPQTLHLLQEMGCEMAQGYHWSKPLPVAEFESFILNYSVNADKNKDLV